ncbi:MAG TPA: hypothetical protein VGF36_06765 [Rhodopila sp.]|jgi:hypothetical protein
MKMMLLAAAVLTLGSASAAFASDSGDLPAPTVFTEIQQAQQAPQQQSSAVAARQGNGNTAIYATQSHNNGTWLFPPDALGGGEQ